VSQPADISVIIVNYGTAALAIEAAQSVLDRHHGGRSVDVHLVDNASPGDDAALLRDAHATRGWGQRVTLYLETTNHGFGRGNNLVLSALSEGPRYPDKIFLLNPDARLENEALAVLADFLDAHPRAGCAGAAITNPGGYPATAAFRFPSLASEFSDTLAFGPVARLFTNRTVPLPADLPTQKVDWVAGAAVMFRWDAVTSAKGFDPAFFLYFEEVDLMRRMAANDWERWYVPDARVCHEEGAATQIRSGSTRRKTRPDYWYDSWLAYHLKASGPWRTRARALARLTGWSLNSLIGQLRGRATTAPARYLDGFSRRVLRPLVGLPARPGRKA
jgi:GT2 family glycosyltransferase